MKTLKYYQLLDKKNSMIPLSYDYLVKSIFDRNQRFLKLFLNSQLKSSLNIDFLDKNTKIKLANNELSKENLKLFLGETEDDEVIRIDSTKIDKIVETLKEKVAEFSPTAKEIILIAPMKLRHLIFLILNQMVPNIRVIAREELLFEYPLQILSNI